jgi:hypothetical protein
MKGVSAPAIQRLARRVLSDSTKVSRAAQIAVCEISRQWHTGWRQLWQQSAKTARFKLSNVIIIIRHFRGRCLGGFSCGVQMKRLLTLFLLAFASAVFANSYSTSFPLTENPISEGNSWSNGLAIGLDWKNVRTTPGFAFGTETGTTEYDDSIASLAGAWGSNQTVQATVRVVASDSASFEEVELHLHRSIAAHNATGYEINFSVKPGNRYVQIVRWNGAYNNWTELKGTSAYYAKDGDVVKATIVGTTITVYINGTSVLSVSDSTYSNGSPGMGFYLQNGTSANSSNFGFSSFSATDGISKPTPPSNLRVIGQ